MRVARSGNSVGKGQSHTHTASLGLGHRQLLPSGLEALRTEEIGNPQTHTVHSMGRVQ